MYYSMTFFHLGRCALPVAHRAMACLLSGVLAMVAQAVEPTPKAWPGKADKACPIYVGAYSVEHE